MNDICNQTHRDQARALPYSFDPVPSALKADRASGHLIDFDLTLASEMIAIGAWRGRRDSCWTTKPVLARRLGVSARTVQSSWARLKARGWILEQRVGPVDPDDPANRTGRRYRFGWAAPSPGTAASEVGSERVRRAAGGQTDEPGEKAASPAPGKQASPNTRRDLKPDQTTDEPVVVAIAGGTRGTGARAEHAPSGSLPEPVAGALADPAIDDRLRRNLAVLSPRWLAAGHPAGRVAAAIGALVRGIGRVRRPVGYVEGVLRNMRDEGDEPAGPKSCPSPSRVPPAAETTRAVEAIRRAEAEAEERERRWGRLSAGERAAIVERDAAVNPRPAGMHAGLWSAARHAACLEAMEALDRAGEGPRKPPTHENIHAIKARTEQKY